MCARRGTTAFPDLSQPFIRACTRLRISTELTFDSKTRIWCGVTAASASEMDSWHGYEAFLSDCRCRVLDCSLVASPGCAIRPLRLRPRRPSRVIKTTGWLSRFHAPAHQSLSLVAVRFYNGTQTFWPVFRDNSYDRPSELSRNTAISSLLHGRDRHGIGI